MIPHPPASPETAYWKICMPQLWDAICWNGIPFRWSNCACIGPRLWLGIGHSIPSWGLGQGTTNFVDSGGETCPFTWYCGTSADLPERMGWLEIFSSWPSPATLSKINSKYYCWRRRQQKSKYLAWRRQVTCHESFLTPLRSSTTLWNKTRVVNADLLQANIESFLPHATNGVVPDKVLCKFVEGQADVFLARIIIM